jgi:enterochelin esterase-like enzyme
MKPALCLLVLTLGCPFARAAVLHAITDALPATAPARISTTTQLVRGGTAAFRHITRAGGDAAEFVIPAAGAGDERWYGWSMQLPPDFDHRGRSTLVMQLAPASPAKVDPNQCPVSTSSLEINAKGHFVFHLHARAERDAEPKCRTATFSADITPTRGRWFDFVLHAKWTSDADGFLDLWVKEHDNNFFHLIDYRGRTCANGESGPEFRIGAHVTAPEELPETEVAVLTDELRIGDAGSSFDDVAPPGAALRAAEAKRGQIRYVVYPSRLIRRHIPVMVYTPPGYDAKNPKRYPVVYNLHGAGGGSPQRQWSRVSATLTNAMDSGTVPPTIYVFVNGLGNTGYLDAPEGRGPKVFSSIVTELVPFIDANYRTIAERRGRAVDGFSMGGGGSMILALKRPDLFSAVVAYAGSFIPHNPDDTNELRRQLSAEFSQYALVERHTDEIRANVRIRLVCGDQDQHHAANLKFKAFLEGLKIPVSWVSIPGVGHDTKGLFDRVGVESLEFMHEGFAKDG